MSFCFCCVQRIKAEEGNKGRKRLNIKTHQVKLGDERRDVKKGKATNILGYLNLIQQFPHPLLQHRHGLAHLGGGISLWWVHEMNRALRVDHSCSTCTNFFSATSCLHKSSGSRAIPSSNATKLLIAEREPVMMAFGMNLYLHEELCLFFKSLSLLRFYPGLDKLIIDC